MFCGNKTLSHQTIQAQLVVAPINALQFVRMGVIGGLSERQVSRALGNAAEASGRAVERVVGDAGSSYKELQRLKKGRDLLG